MPIIKAKRGNGVVPYIQPGEFAYSYDKKKLQIGREISGLNVVAPHTFLVPLMITPLHVDPNLIVFPLNPIFPDGAVPNGTPPIPEFIRIYLKPSNGTNWIEQTGFTYSLRTFYSGFLLQCTKVGHGLTMDNAMGYINFVYPVRYPEE